MVEASWLPMPAFHSWKKVRNRTQTACTVRLSYPVVILCFFLAFCDIQLYWCYSSIMQDGNNGGLLLKMSPKG